MSDLIIETAPAPAVNVPAIGYSFTANIDGNRQIVFQHFVAADATDEEVNRDLDRINGLIDRMRGIYELPELREERHKLAEETSQYTEDLATQAEANFGKVQADLEIQLGTLQADLKKVTEEAYDAHRRSGRTGTFVPKGQTAQHIGRIEAGIRQVIEAKAKNQAEKDVYVTSTKAQIQRRIDRIAILDEKIAAREKAVT